MTGAGGVGVDLSSQMIALFGAQNNNYIDYIQGDINNLCIESSFDAIFFIDSWHFLEDPIAVLEKLRLSMKKHALIFFSFSSYKALEN